jgi:hypothetical protein
MANKPPETIMGKTLGIAVLTFAQTIVGVIHAVLGIWLLSTELAAETQSTLVYDIYTLVFGMLVLIFAYYIWQGKRAGWIGTVLVSVFVVVVDSLAVLNLPTIPGVPTNAAAAEIVYSLLIVGYLCTTRVRRKFLRST